MTNAKYRGWDGSIGSLRGQYQQWPPKNLSAIWQGDYRLNWTKNPLDLNILSLIITGSDEIIANYQTQVYGVQAHVRLSIHPKSKSLGSPDSANYFSKRLSENVNTIKFALFAGPFTVIYTKLFSVIA